MVVELMLFVTGAFILTRGMADDVVGVRFKGDLHDLKLFNRLFLKIKDITQNNFLNSSNIKNYREVEKDADLPCKFFLYAFEVVTDVADIEAKYGGADETIGTWTTSGGG